jgi:signal transduction histidine kinase
LINVSKYAGTGEATVTLDCGENQLRIQVCDQGTGFDVNAVAAGTPAGGGSSKFGLFSIRERMTALGGSFDIQSAPGEGAIATLTMPLLRAA